MIGEAAGQSMIIVSINYSPDKSIDQIAGIVKDLELTLAQEGLHDIFNLLKMMVNVLKDSIRIIIENGFKRLAVISINIKIVFFVERYSAAY